MNPEKQSTKAKAKKKTSASKDHQAAKQEKDEQTARMALSASMNAVAVIEEYGKPMGELNLAALFDSLHDSVEKVWDGDMRRCEAMLLGQAHALQAIFMSLSRRAARQEYLKQYETYLRIALKAQSQCRATLETLATIKNPPVAIVRQANIAHGPQQVNNRAILNSTHVSAQAHAGENQNPQTQLLEAQDGKWLDTGATGAAGRTDQEMATVGAIDRTEDTRG